MQRRRTKTCLWVPDLADIDDAFPTARFSEETIAARDDYLEDIEAEHDTEINMRKMYQDYLDTCSLMHIDQQPPIACSNSDNVATLPWPASDGNDSDNAVEYYIAPHPRAHAQARRARMYSQRTQPEESNFAPSPDPEHGGQHTQDNINYDCDDNNTHDPDSPTSASRDGIDDDIAYSSDIDEEAYATYNA